MSQNFSAWRNLRYCFISILKLICVQFWIQLNGSWKQVSFFFFEMKVHFPFFVDYTYKHRSVERLTYLAERKESSGERIGGVAPSCYLSSKERNSLKGNWILLFVSAAEILSPGKVPLCVYCCIPLYTWNWLLLNPIKLTIVKSTFGKEEKFHLPV